ncbi:hypothetical protein [Paenibacillus paeoniae]|uniref:Uncharacterized protein n=1 Tax=Paenibacillus paeoniae TaxID=2292705 RepID=A0A371PJZ7_9BACL|nr:hypothetical protein [Paenibacillus paeoniae]REK76255.1 hypothetical protein DX130_04155 [Paenibacillus paeoniae]
MKKKLLALIVFVVLISVSVQSYAAKGVDPITKLTLTKGESMDVKETINNGVKVYLISNSNKIVDKNEAAELLHKYVQTKVEAEAQSEKISTQDIGNWKCGIVVTKKGYSTQNGLASNTSSAKDCTYTNVFAIPFQTYGREIEKGSQLANWAGAVPRYPDKIVLRQTTTYSGIAIAPVWPPQLVITGSTGLWESLPITGEYTGSAERLGSKTYTSNWFGSYYPTAEVRDSADIYIGGNIYRPESIIEFKKVYL